MIFIFKRSKTKQIKSDYLPIWIGSSAIASSSVAALFPFFFFEYHKKIKDAKALTINTTQQKYTAYPNLKCCFEQGKRREKKRPLLDINYEYMYNGISNLRIFGAWREEIIKVILYIFNCIRSHSYHNKTD